jgi:hypothetical protein
MNLDITIWDVIIVSQVKTLLDRPVAEFVEQDFSKAINVTLPPLFVGFRHIDTPFRHARFCFLKLLVRDFPVAVCIDEVERNPILVVLSEILQKVSVLLSIDEVLTVLILVRQNIFGSCEGSQKHRFRIEEPGDLNVVEETFFELSERNVPILVLVDEVPLFLATLLVGCTSLPRQLGFEFGPDALIVCFLAWGILLGLGLLVFLDVFFSLGLSVDLLDFNITILDIVIII